MKRTVSTADKCKRNDPSWRPCVHRCFHDPFSHPARLRGHSAAVPGVRHRPTPQKGQRGGLVRDPPLLRWSWYRSLALNLFLGGGGIRHNPHVRFPLLWKSVSSYAVTKPARIMRILVFLLFPLHYRYCVHDSVVLSGHVLQHHHGLGDVVLLQLFPEPVAMEPVSSQ